MAKKKLHPSVEKFKEFVKSNPQLVQEVRKGNTTWQEMFEDWYLLGEDDPKWNSKDNNGKSEKSEEKEKKTDWLGTIMGAVKNINPDEVQGQIQNISQALGAIQGVLAQFQGSSDGQPAPKSQGPAHPFSFRQD